MKSIQLILLSSLLCISAFAQIDIQIREDYQAECNEIKDFVEADYNVACNINYHHYNSSAYRKNYSKTRAKNAGKVRIGGFNVLHPGMSKTRYKDYRRVAELIDEFDVIGVTELLPLIADDLKNNQSVVEFIKETPKEIEELKEELNSLKDARQTATNTRKQEEIEAKIESLESDLKDARDVYRKPGYLKILDALHERTGNKEWALLLSPRGEAAKKTDVQELVGYYYRTTVVKPKVNQYCRDIRTYGRGTPFACIPNMGKDMLGENKKDMFSRRPFLAEFISGDFSFVLLASHVIYTSPTDAANMKRILQQSFGVDHYDALGIGANKGNYARFAEVKVTLDFMEQLRKRFNQKDVILIGDLNLEHDNQFWDTVLQSMPGAKLYVEDLTTVSTAEKTGGFASAYDHFIFDETETSECIDPRKRKVVANVVNFYEGRVGGNVRRTYNVRTDRMSGGKYIRDTRKYNRVLGVYVDPLKNGEETILTIGRKKIKVDGRDVSVEGIIKDEDTIENYVKKFASRVLDSQLKPSSYYEYFKQVISDHMPITMSCSTK